MAIWTSAGLAHAEAADAHALTISAPPGHCAFEPAAPENAGLKTGFKPGLQEATQLVALFVPCDALHLAKAGLTTWLPEWVAFEKNAITMPSDDERNTNGTSREAVDTLCRDAQTRHWQIEAQTFEAKTASAHKSLSDQRPVVYFGVVGNDPEVCYMASLTLEGDPAGRNHPMLNVFAFMAVGDTWVYQTVRRRADDASGAQEVLYDAKNGARDFLRGNE